MVFSSVYCIIVNIAQGFIKLNSNYINNRNDHWEDYPLITFMGTQFPANTRVKIKVSATNLKILLTTGFLFTYYPGISDMVLLFI